MLNQNVIINTQDRQDKKRKGAGGANDQSNRKQGLDGKKLSEVRGETESINQD